MFDTDARIKELETNLAVAKGAFDRGEITEGDYQCQMDNEGAELDKLKRHKTMFGTAAENVLEQFDGFDGKGMAVMGMLSDVQEMIERGMDEDARKRLNVVKLILQDRILEKDERGRLL